MRFLLIGVLGVVSTGCGFKYQSYVEGESPKPEIVKAAVDDLVDVFDRSDATANKISIHPAKGDRIMRPLLEQRLRISGYSVSNIEPGFKPMASAVKTDGADEADESVPMRYRASFIDGVGTFCIGISGQKKTLCRMYNSEGSPVSSITHTGFRIVREDNSSPDDIREEQSPGFEATGSEPREPRSPRPVNTAPIRVKPGEAMTVEAAEPAVRQAIMAVPVDKTLSQVAEPVGANLATAEPVDAITRRAVDRRAIVLVENKQVVPDYDYPDKSAGVWVDLEEALKAYGEETSDGSQTTPQFYKSVPNNLLKRNLDLFLEGLPSEFKISAVTQRLDGESELDYRSRLMDHIKDALHFIKTGAFAYEDKLTVSAND